MFSDAGIQIGLELVGCDPILCGLILALAFYRCAIIGPGKGYTSQ
jgi:hypothetical protein